MPSINPPWSEKDELSLLSSALEIANEPAESFNPRINLFDRIGKNLGSSFSNRDVLDKVKELRRKYEEDCREIREGNDADVMSRAAFEISRKIWGNGGAIRSLQHGAHQLTPVKRAKVSNSSGAHAHQAQGSKSSESGDHQHALKKKMEVSNDFQHGVHQLKSKQNKVDSKCFQLGAHRLASKQKREIAFRNFQYGSSQPPLLPLPPISQLKVFHNFQPGSSQSPLLPLPTSWQAHNSIGLRPPEKSCLPP